MRIFAVACLFSATLLLTPILLAEDTTAAAQPLPLRRKPVETSVRLSSGVASTFQLTLGGTFSDGPAQQNALVVDVKNLVADNGTLRFTVWNTLDTEDGDNDWLAAANYLHPVVQWESGKLTLNLGVQKWQFPSVLRGESDTIIDSGLILTQNGPVAFTLDANVKTLAVGPGRRGVGGQIYYFRGTTAHPILRSGRTALSVVHGPSFTYSNRFYGCNGARVFRYEGGVVFQYGKFSAEAMVRPQVALQRGIPENNYWSAGISYLFQ